MYYICMYMIDSQLELENYDKGEVKREVYQNTCDDNYLICHDCTCIMSLTSHSQASVLYVL